MDGGRKLVAEKLLMDENRLVSARLRIFIVSACHTLIHLHRVEVRPPLLLRRIWSANIMPSDSADVRTFTSALFECIACDPTRIVA